MTDDRSPEQLVRRFFACYSEGRPEDFDQVVAADYQDYGHTPPGVGPQGARDDYEHALRQVGGNVAYTIDATVVDDDVVAAVWTGTLPNGSTSRGVSVYRIRDGRIASTRHARLG
jgi:ketosteroid isomerase-like protein